MYYKKITILIMMDMKNKLFYLKLLLLIVMIMESVSFNNLSKIKESDLFVYEDDISYVLVEKNIIDKSFISFLYKNDFDNYKVEYYDYKTNKKIELNDLIKEEYESLFNQKIKDLLFLKYPKFIANALLEENVVKSILFRDNELVIYYNEYEINPEVNEVLYLNVNYNEIKDYLNFSVVLESDYENESGYNYDKEKKSIAITFDDSPNNGKTNKILDYLKDNHFHATFFVVGEKCEYNEDLLISIKNSGNEIGSHTYSHQNLNKLTEEEIIEDYKKMNNIYKRLFNENLKLLRPPYGLYKEKYLNIIDTSIIMWSLDTNDWKNKNSDYLVNYVVNNVKDGDIILFHDSYDSTVDAIEELLPILYSKGYQVMSVSELAKIKGKILENGKVYNKFN